MSNQYTTWHIRGNGRDGGMGSFLCPPGHPAHNYRVERGPSNNPKDSMSLMHAVSDEEDGYVPAAIRARVKGMLSRATLVESEGWQRNVYGYFRSCYLPESGSRNASDVIIDKTCSLPAERSSAVALIREYFPNHQPRLDLIEAAQQGTVKLYGSYPCAHCGERVQYEAKWDAYVRFNAPAVPCDKAPDGRHQWEA